MIVFVLQETPESVPEGETPHTVQVRYNEAFADSCVVCSSRAHSPLLLHMRCLCPRKFAYFIFIFCVVT